jgi:hypothetical protein
MFRRHHNKNGQDSKCFLCPQDLADCHPAPITPPCTRTYLTCICNTPLKIAASHTPLRYFVILPSPPHQLVYSQPCVEENWSCEQPPDVLMGVVASDSRLGVRALRDWCEALGLPYLQPENRVSGWMGSVVCGSCRAVAGCPAWGCSVL